MDVHNENKDESTAKNQMFITFGPDIAEQLNIITREFGPLDGPVEWSAVLSRLLLTHAPARPYAWIVPMLISLADSDDLPGARIHISNKLGYFLAGSILESQIIAARRLAQERSGIDILCAQDLLFFGILRCATRVSEMGQSVPQHQGHPLTAERLNLLAFEIAIMSLSPDDHAKALTEYDDTRLGLSRLIPTGDDPGTAPSDIRRRLREAKIDIIPIEPSSQGVALVLRDDPWAPGLQDRSGAEAEVAAFAALFTARAFQPPLAVGIFGAWGAGKSFFMRMLHHAVEDFVVPEADNPDTLQHVIQIHFNAWHYAETNLWASIIDRIFTELDDWTRAANPDLDLTEISLVEQLDTSRKLAIGAIEPLIAARRQQSEAKAKLEDAARVLATKRDEVAATKNVNLKAAFDTILQDNTLRQKVDDAANTLGLNKLHESVESFRSVAHTLNNQASTSKAVRTLIGRIGRGWGLFLCASVLLGPLIIATALPAILLWFFPSLINQIGAGTSLVAGISGMLAIAIGTLRIASHHTEKALETIRIFEGKLDAEIVKRSADQTSAYVLAKAEAAKAQAEVDRRRDALIEAARQADLASVAFSTEEPRQRLAQFLRERIGSGTYARELGVIAAVRKDFEMLSRLMAASAAADTPETRRTTEIRFAMEAEVKRILKDTSDILEPEERATLQRLSQPPSKPPVTLERIILYIDDLDRCPPDQVVAVLQAIHLLLAFPLFIVVVAVDSRWVLNALNSHYGCLLGSQGNSASAMDYLEKIIQIPYRVRSIRIVDGNSMIGDLLGPFLAQSIDKRSPSRDTPAPVNSNAALKNDRPYGADTVPVIALAKPGPKLRKHLSIEANELDLLNRIDGLLDWSPRRRLRFANSYLLSRASVSEISETDLSNLAILLACADEDDRNSAAKRLCEKMDLSWPPPEKLEWLHALCDRFSFRTLTNTDNAQTQTSL